MDAVKDTAQQAHVKAAGAAEETKVKAGQLADSGKEAVTGTEPGILQKTGDGVKGFAAGAADAVKNTFGMAGDKAEEAKKGAGL